MKVQLRFAVIHSFHKKMFLGKAGQLNFACNLKLFYLHKTVGVVFPPKE